MKSSLESTGTGSKSYLERPRYTRYAPSFCSGAALSSFTKALDTRAIYAVRLIVSWEVRETLGLLFLPVFASPTRAAYQQPVENLLENFAFILRGHLSQSVKNAAFKPSCHASRSILLVSVTSDLSVTKHPSP